MVLSVTQMVILIAATVQMDKKSYGTYIFANGDTFSGTYINDSAGNGTYKFVNGNTLFGDFSDMSDCQLTYTVDGKKYLTQWKNGRCSSITKK